MVEPNRIVLVRFRSALSLEDVTKVIESRAPAFRALAGLQQKYYMQDAASGEFAGLYLWESPEAFSEYGQSQLRTTIAKAYQIEGEPRVEVYRVMKALREDPN